LHAFVRLRFIYSSDADLKTVGLTLEKLGQLRTLADYRPETPGKFASSTATDAAVQEARDALALLDQIDSDPTRRSAAIAAIRAAFP
jgi:hypothetical protein